MDTLLTETGAHNVFGLSSGGLIALQAALIPASLTPDWVQTAMKFNPVYYAVEAVRPLFLTGYDWMAIGQALAVCGAFAIVGIVVAEFAFRRFGD